MLSTLAPARRRLVLTVLGAVLVVAVGAAGVSVTRVLHRHPVADQGTPGPVLVVPGYGGQVSSIAPIVAELRRERRTVVAFTPTGGGTGDLQVQATRLGELAQRVMKQDGASSVDVVGYSAGGVVARLWVRDYGGASVVRRVVTVGSPHHGTDVAAIAREAVGTCPKACEQLAPDSDLLRRLNAGDETPDGPRWITLRSSDDHVVTPTSSASLAGALDLLVQDFCPDNATTHDGLPSDPVVLAALASALGKGEPTAPRKVSC